MRSATLLSKALEPSRPHIEAAHLELQLISPNGCPPPWPTSRRSSGSLPLITIKVLRTRRLGGRKLEVVHKVPDGHLQIIGCGHRPGIRAKTGRWMSEQFVRVTRTAKMGAGLGLSITGRIIDAHGGFIAVESELGKGATFTFMLPASVVGRA